MNRLHRVVGTVVTLLFLLCASQGAWAAGDPFIGNWKLNPSLTRLPDEMKVESKGGNTYTFNFAGDPETIKVDGTDQPGIDGTMLSVKPDAPDTWTVERKKAGRRLLHASWKLSPDGGTITDLFRGFDPSGSTFSVDYVYRRSGGGSGFAGDWQSVKETMNSPYLLEVKQYESDGLSFISTTPAGQKTRNLKLDGKEYPAQGTGTNAGPAFSSRRVGEHALEMTGTVAGKVVDQREISLSPDGKTLTMTVHAPGLSKPEVFVFDRQ